MIEQFPVSFRLKDGTQVVVYQREEQGFEFHLKRLNSEKHNFWWTEETGIEESYETRFDQWQLEAIDAFRKMKE